MEKENEEVMELTRKNIDSFELKVNPRRELCQGICLCYLRANNHNCSGVKLYVVNRNIVVVVREVVALAFSIKKSLNSLNGL